jgi:hypothetical protein
MICLRRRHRTGSTLLVAAVVTIAGAGCLQRIERQRVAPERTESLDRRSRYLKVHRRDGSLCVLSGWRVDEQARLVHGDGVCHDPARSTQNRGSFAIGLDSVVVFETNVAHLSPAIVPMTIITGASVALTVYCASNPKACFGSCPTFYVADATGPLLQAEGFSASIAPSLEATDVDALFRAQPKSRELDVRMTNEALETHVVRHVEVLAALRPHGGRVAATHDGFVETFDGPPLRVARGPEGECTESLLRFDGHERFSTTDSTDLTARELVELEFEAGDSGPYGLRIACRQTLLATYVLYQSLGYLGSRASDWLAELERGKLLPRHANAFDALGGIEVLVEDGHRWRQAGTVDEHGPIATDVHLIRLPEVPRGLVRIRLRAARGMWRLDQVALVRLGNDVTPVRIAPHRIEREDEEDPGALALLRDPKQALTTGPGDQWVLNFLLPEEFNRYELFLESRGYYLEWMREEWIAEEDPARAMRFFLDPPGALRDIAPEFKRVESQMEDAFWRSRYVRR